MPSYVARVLVHSQGEICFLRRVLHRSERHHELIDLVAAGIGVSVPVGTGLDRLHLHVEIGCLVLECIDKIRRA